MIATSLATLLSTTAIVVAAEPSQQIENATEKAVEAVKDAASTAQEAIENAAEEARESTRDAGEAAESATQDAMESAKDAAESAENAVERGAENLEQAAESAADTPMVITSSQAKEWVGKRIHSRDENDIGEIADFRAGSDGNVEYFHSDIGGFLGLGETSVKIKPSHFEMREGKLYLNMTKDEALQLPRIDG